MKYLCLAALAGLMIAPFHSAMAEEGAFRIDSMTVEGGPIWSKHFQAGGDGDFRENHGLAVLKIHTNTYGNWGIYYLGPNSVDDTSIGFGYLTNPYIIPLGQIDLELSGGLGLVTGYQDYPVPLVVGEARLALYEQGNWNAGVAMAAIPYYTRGREDDSDDHFGIVGTSPYLSIRYAFD